MATMTNPQDFGWFEELWKALKITQDKDLVLKMSPDAKRVFYKASMEAVGSLGRNRYDCRDFMHPGKTCTAYNITRLMITLKNGLFICSFATLLPLVVKNRKKLFQSDLKTALRTLISILWKYVRNALFICFGAGLPFVLICRFGFFRHICVKLPWFVRVMLFYGLFPMATLGLDLPTKMPSYVGFFGSKAISMGWALLKTHQIVPKDIPLEKHIGLAALAGIIGYLSVKQSAKAQANPPKVASKLAISIKGKDPQAGQCAIPFEGGPDQKQSNTTSEGGLDGKEPLEQKEGASNGETRQIKVEFLLGSLT